MSTIQAAINRANGFGGYNLILVTDDVADGVWHENLKMENLRSDLSLEIVGGFNNCAELASTGDKADIYGGDEQRPVLKIRGRVDVKLRNLWMEGGTRENGITYGGGIYFKGSGSVELANVKVTHNYPQGIEFDGSGGDAQLKFVGAVDVSNHVWNGIGVKGTAELVIHGDGNTIRENGWLGIGISAPAFADIGATGKILFGNGEGGIAVEGIKSNPGRTTRMYSTDPANPLAIEGNRDKAVIVNGVESPYRLCLKNVAITNNTAHAIYARGAQAQLDLNTDCDYPPEANFSCVAPGDAGCNSIDRNVTPPGKPLIAAVDGAQITIDRMRIVGNTASSILSTNLGTATSASSITMTNSVVAINTLRDNLFESLGDGIVDIYESTMVRNAGGFGLSLVGIDPGLLQVTNSIIDQPQALMDLQGDPATARLNRVMVRNSTGAHLGDDLLISAPAYVPNSFRLQTDSPGVDYAPPGGGIDYDGNPRDVDTIGVINRYGPRDLGAYESQSLLSDRIFKGDFEAAP